MTRNISYTSVNPSAGQGKNMIRVCFVCHGNIIKQCEKPHGYWV